MDFISSILQDLLNTLFSFTGDLGIAIVLITLMVKLLLMPLSLKQRFAMRKQQDLVGQMSHIKEKYKNNTKELEKQLQKHSAESMKSMLGCSTLILQMPVVYALYNTFLNMTQVSSSALIPWISSLNVSDNLFIIPCIYALTMLAPNLISFIPYFKASTQIAFNKQMAITTVIMSFILTAKTPVSIGLYFITSSMYSLIEDVCFRIYVKQKNKLSIN
ncbi:YidC/Oxa1 family membrane protein insertase [Romboutsia sedimentorum]|jgi:YidC/Oxa1 family membrane protein insertase|uniref:YidC/Oxa1 family membrane protein insertase n=1 Tax=Romboutsia sedimentorum TaxID=1368474 RepID=A0ABT7E5Z0_9FIRM|nr:YidC/Oxa1 family membrane protein insertase [Romboutsia sedimentorum]MDK2562344.1 YidC/Oxa1 family membrane protein insertase [Romboutsia sedimentorum]